MELTIYKRCRLILTFKVVPRLCSSVTGLSPRSPGCDPIWVQVRLVLDKAMGQIFLLALRFSPVSIITPMLHTRLHLLTTLIRRTSGRSLATCCVGNRKFCSSFNFNQSTNSLIIPLQNIGHPQGSSTALCSWRRTKSLPRSYLLL